jgi:hypothetical protein
MISDQRYYATHSTFTVDSVDKETGEVFLQETMPRVFPAEAGPGEPEFAVEVALLRRDVVFTVEHDPDQDWTGGHSIIYFTPTVVQTIQGVRFLDRKEFLAATPSIFTSRGSLRR